MEIRFAKRILGWNVGVFLHPAQALLTLGVTNETEDGYFVPFLDYDAVDYSRVLKDILHLHRVFGLCFFMVTVNSEENLRDEFNKEKTIGHYAVWGLDKLTYAKCLEVVRHTRCDEMAKRVGGRLYAQRNWVLRIAPKVDLRGNESRPSPKLKEIVQFGGCRFKHSKAHYNLYKTYFGAEFQIGGLDRGSEIEQIQYMTMDKKRRR